jgi:hypothetical protein
LNITNALKSTTLVSRDQCHLGRPSRRISFDSWFPHRTLDFITFQLFLARL